jgi:hypothetical protein
MVANLPTACLSRYFSMIIIPRQNEGQSKSSPISLTSTVWCTMNSYRLDRMLLAIYACKVCWGCGMQFGGSSASGRQGQWFLHLYNTPRHTSLVMQQFLSSPNHRTLRISLRVTFDCSLLWKWASSDVEDIKWKCDDQTPKGKAKLYY